MCYSVAQMDVIQKFVKQKEKGTNLNCFSQEKGEKEFTCNFTFIPNYIHRLLPTVVAMVIDQSQETR
jgi:hypothetical protein